MDALLFHRKVLLRIAGSSKMSPEEKSPRPQTLAVVIATAAVTLAVGVTTAALTGHLFPRPRSAPPAAVAAPTSPAVVKDPPPSVVLVPVTRDPAPAPLGRAARSRRAPAVLAAAESERDDDDDGEHGASPGLRTPGSTKMTTTDSRRVPTEPPGLLTSLKLYLTAFLAGLYLVIWWSLGSRAPSSDQPMPAPPPPVPQQSSTAVWYRDLPPSARPVVQLPQGWRVAEETSSPPAADEAPPLPVRVAPGGARIRTRARDVRVPIDEYRRRGDRRRW